MKKFALLCIISTLFFNASLLTAQIVDLNIDLNFKDSSNESPVVRAKVFVVSGEDTIASGFSDESGIFSFQTELDVTGLNSPPIAGNTLSIFPNPVSGKEIYLYFNSHASSIDELEIKLFDLSGRARSISDYLESGNYILHVHEPASGFQSKAGFIISQPGFYSFRLKDTAPGSDTKKSANNEGVPYHVYAEKSEYVTFNDTVYILRNQEDYKVNLNPAEKPVPGFSVDGSYRVGETLVFDGSESAGANEEDLKYTWNFGDGSNAGGEKAAHIYSEPGIYDVYLVAVGKYGAKDSLEKSVEISPDNLPSDTALISAFVSLPGGDPLEGATITVSGIEEEFLTDAQGEAEIRSAVGVDAVIRVSKQGYTTQTQYIRLSEGSEFGDHYFTMIPRNAPVTLQDVEYGFDYTSPSGARVSLPVEGLVDKDGTIVTGSVDVSFTPVDVSDNEVIKAFPGEFAGITPEGEAPVLLTYGVSEYLFEQNGEQLQLKEGKFATIEIPVFITTHLDGSPVVPGDESPVWSLNEKTGRWVEEGTGVVVENSNSPTGLALRAEVSHFSWWNHDIAPDPYYPIPECKINDENGLPTLEIPSGGACFIDGALIGPNGPRGRPNTLGDGNALPVPPNQDMWLIASGGNGVYQGKVKINGAAGVYEEIIIPMDMVYSGGDGDLIEADTLFDAAIESLEDVDTYTFNTIEGISYNLGVGRTPNSNLTGAVSVYDGEGKHLRTSSFGENGFNYAFTAEGNDTYTVEVKGSENVPGAYRLYLEIIPKVKLDSSFTVETFFDGQVKKYLFDAGKDQLIYPYVRSEGSTYYRVRVKDPNGNTVLNENDRYVNTPGYHQVVADGLYTLEIVSSRNEEKMYNVGLALISNPSVYPQEEEISILSDSAAVYGKPYFFSFEGNKDDVINYALHVRDSLSAYYTLYGPGEEAFYMREEIGSNDVVNFDGKASDDPYNGRYVLPDSGEYVIKVQAGRVDWEGSFSGGFSLYLFRPEVRDIEFDSVYMDSIKTIYNIKRYRFDLEKPTSLSMVYTNFINGGYLYASIYDKNGNYVTNTRSNTFTGSVTYAEISGFYLDSLVYLEFNPSGSASGNYEFNLVENEDPLEVQSDVPWYEWTGEISKNGEIDYYKFTADSGQILGLTYLRGENSLRQRFSVYKAGDNFASGDVLRDDWYGSTDLDVGGSTHQFTAEIPSSGEYIIRVNGLLAANFPERATGDYSLRLNLLDKASSIVVDDVNNDNPDASTGFVRSALRAVGDNGSVSVEPGEYLEIGNLIVDYENVSLTGADSATTYVELNSSTGVDVRKSGLSVRDLHFYKSSGQAFYLRRDASDFSLEDSKITGGEAVEGAGDNHNTIIRNNYFRSGGSIGVRVSGDNVLIENNRLNTEGGNVNTGVSLRGIGNSIRGNTIGSKDSRSVSFTAIVASGDSAVIENNQVNTYAFGIEARSTGSGNVNYAIIRNNTLGSLTGSNGGNSDGIIVRSVDNAQVYNNEITGHPDLSRGIRFTSSGGKIYNNRIRINRFDGVYANTTDASPELVIVNNTIVKTGSYGGHGNIKILNDGTTSPVRILNNVMVTPATSNTSHYGVFSEAGILEADHNLFYGHTAYYSSNLSLGANDVTADPLFADDELRLDAASPAIDAGTSSFAPSVDFEGTVRPTGSEVDIGADEFN